LPKDAKAVLEERQRRIDYEAQNTVMGRILGARSGFKRRTNGTTSRSPVEAIAASQRTPNIPAESEKAYRPENPRNYGPPGEHDPLCGSRQLTMTKASPRSYTPRAAGDFT
jgi:hypothetical protein